MKNEFIVTKQDLYKIFLEGMHTASTSITEGTVEWDKKLSKYHKEEYFEPAYKILLKKKKKQVKNKNRH